MSGEGFTFLNLIQNISGQMATLICHLYLHIDTDGHPTQARRKPFFIFIGKQLIWKPCGRPIAERLAIFFHMTVTDFNSGKMSFQITRFVVFVLESLARKGNGRSNSGVNATTFTPFSRQVSVLSRVIPAPL